jgi:hypothetical protein
MATTPAKKKATALVLQFPDSYFAAGDLAALEQRITAWLPRTATYDGSERGSGMTNLVISTAFPVAVYKMFRSRIATRAMERKLRIAYRTAGAKTYTNLWPRRDPRPFALAYPTGADPFKPSNKRAIPKRSPRGTRAL